ncbi:hypothetical protein FE257_006596 [Aspergillus nanangensis]|uniref:Cytochrome P450 monooxygenase n=1 Tax=Aspergillus nanangensis TaxID=2582783 RepID=A0AAD4CXT4_ASPNN|nr:hypothetical protein FE257_006596 [Aspergillus nanangensis]
MSQPRSVLITGGTASLGYHCALNIARQHPEYQVILASRTNPHDAAESINRLLHQTNVRYIPLDLSNLAQVRSFAHTWASEQLPPIQTLLLNAGLQFPGEVTYTPDGIESTFGINHVGHALLFSLLRPHLCATARIVVTSSGTHDPAQKTGLPDAVYTSAEELAHPSADSKKNPGAQRDGAGQELSPRAAVCLESSVAARAAAVAIVVALMVLLAALPLFAIYLYDHLRRYRLERFAALPQLKPSVVFGHLQALNKFIVAGEPKRHTDIVFLEVARHLGNPPLFALDLWPVERPLAIICSHEIAEQVSRSSRALPYSLPKSPYFSRLRPLLGPNSIITAEGERWKALRKRFNPGFAPQHLMSLLPCVLGKAWPFLRNLDHFASSGEEFRLDEVCINLTFDIIGAVTMDVDLHAQLGQDQQAELVQLYRHLVRTYRDRSIFERLWCRVFPLVLAQRWNLTRRIDNLLTERIKAKFAELKPASAAAVPSPSRSVLDLSLQDITHLDADILAQTCDQLKSFLFAGHETTAILLQWAFYELSRTPRALATLRRELDDIFGADSPVETVRDMLLSDQREDLLARMSYTSAVIKELLRLYPPSGTARYLPRGSGFTVELPDGRAVCLDEMVIYNCDTIVHRDGAVYGPSVDEFRPERWLGDTDTSMETNHAEAEANRVPSSAWRPFERGPRNCIGQELANLEARIILACTVRRYDFEKVGLGEIMRDGNGEPVLGAKGQYTVKEEEVYNTMQVTAKPVDGMRVKVRWVDGASPLE